MFEIGLNRAVTLLAEKKAKGPGRRGAQTLKDLGAAPDGKAIKVLKGKFGPYVSDGETNATLPEGTEPEAVTMEQALAWIAERAARSSKNGGGKKKKTRATAQPKAEKKAKAEKAEKPNGAEKKTAAKKTTTNKKKAAKSAAKAVSKAKAPGKSQGKPKVPELAGE